jgi:aryl-alcohol dehydrogenase-like predicted oxidoreductase
MLRDFERDILPMARHFGMALAPWEVLGGGHFQSEKQIAEREKNGEKLRRVHSDGQTEEEKQISQALSTVAAEHGTESVAAIALAYILCKAPNVFPLIGGRKIEHLQDNIQALKIRLTKKQIEFLEKAKEFDVGFPNNLIGADPKTTGEVDGSHVGRFARVDYVLAPRAIGYELGN